LALTTNPNRDYRVRFCFPDKHNFHLDLPEIIYDHDINSFVDKIISFRTELLDRIKGKNNLMGYCDGCSRKKLQIWTNDAEFSVINIGGHPSPCNFKCSYCDARSNDNTVAFSAKLLTLYNSTLAELKKRDKINKGAVIVLANGEITVNPSQNGYLSLAEGHTTRILTNASKFSRFLAEKLSDGNSCLLVSVDAGTTGTFRKLKGVDAFDRVSYNLREYSKYGKIVLKYILIPGVNDNDDDCFGIVSILEELSLSSLWVSTDVFMLNQNTTHLLVEPLAQFIQKLNTRGIRAYGYDNFLDKKASDRLINKLTPLEE
jgi:wyosine [tRNA(Phe)-imidazoG37] synthetase (radical SAM superfamily)